jgi:diadenosine tetraphosphate (Ap4A) HIT family hydrolase
MDVMAEQPCPFCEIAQDPSSSRLLADNEHAFVIADGYPVTDGHTLIIPKRHVASFFELTEQERDAMLSLLDTAKAKLDQDQKPAGYNIGINDGPAAGQTVPHCHLHLIPRYDEDNKERGADPRGGIRWVVPEKADYWSGRE